MQNVSFREGIWVFLKIGVHQNGWFFSWKTLLKWMIWGTPIFENTYIDLQVIDDSLPMVKCSPGGHCYCKGATPKVYRHSFPRHLVTPWSQPWKITHTHLVAHCQGRRLDGPSAAFPLRSSKSIRKICPKPKNP